MKTYKEQKTQKKIHKRKHFEKYKRNVHLIRIGGIFISILIIGIIIGFCWNRGNNKVKEDNQPIQEKEESLTDEKRVEDIQIIDSENNALCSFQEKLEEKIDSLDGMWSVYVKNLETNDTISINNQEMYAASLIKLYVMESCYQYMDRLLENESLYLGDVQAAKDIIKEKLEEMIEQSDNEAYNDLVSLHSENLNFEEGCYLIDDYLEDAGYEDTKIFHTLSPSDTQPQAISDIKNYTSVEDCGKLLESIYRGTCVSPEASDEMLKLLEAQENINKIPEGIPNKIEIANKTGETEEVQHDVAIVYGEKTDYIICVMSTGMEDSQTAIKSIQNLSGEVYNYLNEN